MAIQSSDNDKKLFNEINITPLTDIFLVLLIIMMVVAPMFQSIDKNISIPEINSGINVENDKVTVAVSKEGDFYLNGKQINPNQLEDELKSLQEKAQEKIVVVKADEQTKNSEIIKIIRAAQSSGYEKLTVAGEPLSRKHQKDLKEENKNTSLPE